MNKQQENKTLIKSVNLIFVVAVIVVAGLRKTW